MAANMGDGFNTKKDESNERKKPEKSFRHYRRRRHHQYHSKPHHRPSPVVQDFIAFLHDVATLTQLIKKRENTYWEQIQENIYFLYSEQLNRDLQLAMPSAYRKCLLKLCHDLLWIEYYYPDLEREHSFFSRAMTYLKQEYGSSFNEDPEYNYLLKLEKIKNEASDFYLPFQQFESLAQAVESIGDDKVKVYEAVNIQMDKVLNPVVLPDDGHEANQRFDALCAELSPKSSDKKIATVLTCLKGLAVSVLGLGMQGLGLALIGFSLASGIGSGALSLPFSLLGIGAGIGLIALGDKVRDEGVAIFSGALKAQESRKRVCRGLKTLQKNVIPSSEQSLGNEDVSSSSAHHRNLSNSPDTVKKHSENGRWTWSLPNPLSWFHTSSSDAQDAVSHSSNPFTLNYDGILKL